MAFVRGANVVTNGLVLALDAANPKSYVSGSTTWNDLSSKFTANLSGPVSFSTGSIPALFYTSSAWVYVNNQSVFNTLTNNFTVLGWINPIEFFTGARLFGLGYTNQWQFELRGGGGTRLSINYNQGAGNIFQVNGPTVSLNTWQHVGFVINNSVVNYIYNGQITNTGTFTITGDFVNGNQNYSVGNYGAAVDGRFPGFIALNQLYNRALSAAEVLQNYNATKARFGL